ncbi:anti-sigma factor [Portibacter lacus]|uniref:Uncharacterized protein n=1 Tax=Portibacter lacus TaxID=1099794 RepID=A0AA37SRI1_9BACT|nr:hypothetical protein [Portibacter lacus]GLR16550.1 hypothetical protein GCM10007940_11650 [Portibacter lacus]
MQSRTNDLQDFRQQVDLYLDRALNTEDERQLLDRVNHDPNCGRVLSKEQNFRNFIKQNVKRSEATPDFIQAIKNKIRID